MMEEMRRNIEYALSSVEKYEVTLRKKYQSTISKIEDERNLQEKYALRRDFLEKLQTNMSLGLDEARSKLDAAESAMGAVQQKETDVKYKLDVSMAKLNEMLEQNKRDVEPELDRLRELLHATKEETSISARAYATDEQRLKELLAVNDSITSEDDKLKLSITEMKQVLADVQLEPNVYKEKLVRLQQDTNIIQSEIDATAQSTKEVQSKIDHQEKCKADLDEQKNAESKKLQQQQTKLQEKRLRVDGFTNEVAEERVHQHSLAAEKVQIQVNTKKTQQEIKHDTKYISVENRQLNIAKSTLVKKQQTLIQMKSSIPQMKAKLKDLQQTKSIMDAEKQTYEHTLAQLKEKVDTGMMKLYDEEYVETDTLDRLNESAKAVASGECGIEKARVQEKKANKLLSLSKEKRAFTQRKIVQFEQMKNDLSMEINAIEVQKLDLTKMIKNTEKKTQDFALLHDVIKTEEADCTRLISQTQQAFNNMKERGEVLQLKLRACNNERDKKMKMLQDVVNAKEQAQQSRATKSSDKSTSLLAYQQALEDVERQEAHIVQLEATLRNVKREVERFSSQTEQLLAMKESMSEQLKGRKNSLVEMAECALSNDENLKRVEIDNQRKEVDIHMVELKNADIQRSIDLLKKELDNQTDIDGQIEAVKEKLETQILETERLCRELECPNEGDRLRQDTGEDLSEEDLTAKLATLERLLQKKKEILITKSLEVKEVHVRTQQQEEAKQEWTNVTQTVLNDINDYQGRLQQKKRLQMAQQSELCIYNEIISACKTKVQELEHDIELRKELAISNSRKNEEREDSPLPRNDSTPPSNQRPTAYLPVMNENDENETLNVPRPYGGLAPFQAGKIVVGSPELYRLKQAYN